MRTIAVALMFLGGCKFPDLDPIEIDAAPIDAAVIDAPPPCVANTIVCDDTTDTYTECSPEGTVVRQLACGIGCDTIEEKCLEIDPSNGVAMYLDMARDRIDAPAVTFAAGSTIDGSGTVFNAGTSITVPSAVVAGARVYMFKSLTIGGGATLKGLGVRPLILVSDGPVLFEGTLDVSADGDSVAPGAVANATCNGGSVGGTPAPGGGGGAGVSGGARGGNSGSTLGGVAGMGGESGTAIPLVGGCSGGFSVDGSSPSTPGGGGGAVQVVGRVSITVRGSGAIDASGGGGRSFGSGSGTNIGGAGGGGGGVVFLESPQIILDGFSVVISAKGGGGAAAGNGQIGHQGADGGTGATAAAGGTNVGAAAGGAGATFDGFLAVAPVAGGNGASGQAGAGGGGGLGLAIFHTLSGAINPQNGASIWAGGGTGTIGTRRVP